MLGRPFVGAAALVLAVEAGNGEIDPPATFAHFLLESRPLDMVARRSVQRQNSVPVAVLAVRDVAVPSVPKLYSLLPTGPIQGLLLLGELNAESLQIPLHQLLHKQVLPLALLLGPFIDDMVVLLL